MGTFKKLRSHLQFEEHSQYDQRHKHTYSSKPTDTWLLILPTYCVLSHSVVSDSVQPRGLQPARLLGPWNPPGKNTGVGCHFLLQGIFPTQGSNWVTPNLHWQAGSLPPGKPIVIQEMKTRDNKRCVICYRVKTKRDKNSLNVLVRIVK